MPAFHRSSLLSPSGTSLFLFGCTNSITLDSCCQIEFVTWYEWAAKRPGFRGFGPPLAGWFKRFRGEGGRPFGPKGLCPTGKGLCSLRSRGISGFAADGSGIATIGGNEYKSRLSAVMPAGSIIPTCTVVHPRAASRPSPPKGGARAIWKSAP